MAALEGRVDSISTIQTINASGDHLSQEKVEPQPTPIQLDIEHALVNDDPREWPKTRKWAIVVMICAAAMIAGLGGNIYNPAILQIQDELHATSNQMSLTLSLFILIQGGFPVLWSAISEIQGRKLVYLVSITLCTLGGAVAGLSKNINVLIGMRCLQAAGSSAVVSIGAATLADLYEPSERGTMMGIYLCAPLLGPSIGPIIGGVLTQVFGWRATFWFLVIFTGICAISFVFFRDTFRRERSLSYQTVLKRLHEHELKKARMQTHAEVDDDDASTKLGHAETKKEADSSYQPTQVDQKDVEAQKTAKTECAAPQNEVTLTLKDVNPIGPIFQVLRRANNVVIILASGLLFAFEYSILYTASRTLGDVYGYDALKIGLVLLSFGAGALLGSMLGGRYSDRVLASVRAKHSGVSTPEMRLQSTWLPMWFFPPSVVAYGWVCEERVHIAAVCVMLFLTGFFAICIYSSTLAYIVDANTGRSSSAVATNSCIRGVLGFTAAEIAVPLQDSIGDGGLYSMWAGLMVVSELMIILVWWKGGRWREQGVAREQSK